jgi:hypothetical protein
MYQVQFRSIVPGTLRFKMVPGSNHFICAWLKSLHLCLAQNSQIVPGTPDSRPKAGHQPAKPQSHANYLMFKMTNPCKYHCYSVFIRFLD